MHVDTAQGAARDRAGRDVPRGRWAGPVKARLTRSGKPVRQRSRNLSGRISDCDLSDPFARTAVETVTVDALGAGPGSQRPSWPSLGQVRLRLVTQPDPRHPLLVRAEVVGSPGTAQRPSPPASPRAHTEMTDPGYLSRAEVVGIRVGADGRRAERPTAERSQGRRARGRTCPLTNAHGMGLWHTSAVQRARQPTSRFMGRLKGKSGPLAGPSAARLVNPRTPSGFPSVRTPEIQGGTGLRGGGAGLDRRW